MVEPARMAAWICAAASKVPTSSKMPLSPSPKLRQNGRRRWRKMAAVAMLAATNSGPEWYEDTVRMFTLSENLEATKGAPGRASCEMSRPTRASARPTTSAPEMEMGPVEPMPVPAM